MPDHLRTRARSAPWQELLCRSYVAVFFHGAEHLGKDGDSWPPVLSWAFGALGNGDAAVIGMWAEGASCETVWFRALADLKARGLERIRFAVTDDPTAFGEDLQTQFPGALSLPSFAGLLDRSVRQVQPRDRAPVKNHLLAILQAGSSQAAQQSFSEFESSCSAARYPALVTDWRLARDQGRLLWSLAPTLRREVLRGDARATSLQLSVGKALARHGGFADPSAALSFVQTALARAQRRFDAARSTATRAQRPLLEVSPFRGVALGG
ncbi:MULTISPECIES: transposase [unclassified Rubrivivax]|uniref:transposase n=1 Tax=unclassified Rubrivivax TaxID=2649762 RepID=UPI001E4570CF|nr:MULTISPECIES: transposase [unclassified Rubrivivax]MCC9596431.1 transposase [Rubrivivax sp. JA1055]MCC9647225.1 transposase [Rubrivivax sp. JA1029]